MSLSLDFSFMSLINNLSDFTGFCMMLNKNYKEVKNAGKHREVSKIIFNLTW